MNSKQKRRAKREYFRALPGVIESLEFQYRVLAGRRADPFQWARNPEDRAAYLRREIAYLRRGDGNLKMASADITDSYGSKTNRRDIHQISAWFDETIRKQISDICGVKKP